MAVKKTSEIQQVSFDGKARIQLLVEVFYSDQNASQCKSLFYDYQEPFRHEISDKRIVQSFLRWKCSKISFILICISNCTILNKY